MSRRTVFCAAAVAAVVVLLGMVHPWLLRAMSQWLDVGERPRAADYVMVQGGDETSRPFVAAVLIKGGYAKCAITVKAMRNPDISAIVLPPAHEIIRQVLEKCGVPKRDILILPGEATTTFDEAAALAAFLEDRPHVKVLVVTNDYHTRRSRWIFRGVLGDRADQISFVSAPTDYFPIDHWWQYEEGFVVIINEYIKLAFYLIYYGRLGYWLAACGVLMLTVAWARRRASMLSFAAE